VLNVDGLTVLMTADQNVLQCLPLDYLDIDEECPEVS